MKYYILMYIYGARGVNVIVHHTRTHKHRERRTHTYIAAQSAGAVEYTDCFSTEE